MSDLPTSRTGLGPCRYQRTSGKTPEGRRPIRVLLDCRHGRSHDVLQLLSLGQQRDGAVVDAVRGGELAVQESDHRLDVLAIAVQALLPTLAAGARCPVAAGAA